MKKYVLLIVIFFATFGSFTQVKQVSRKQYEKDQEGLGNTVVLGKLGLVLYGIDKENGQLDKLNLSMLNSEFKENGTKSIEITKKFNLELTLVAQDQQNIYFLFKYKDDFIIYNYDVSGNTYAKLIGKFPPKFRLMSATVLNNTAFILGYAKGAQQILKMELFTGDNQLIKIPGEEMKHIFGMPVKIEGKELVSFQMTSYKTKKDAKTELCIIDEQGEFIQKPVNLDQNPEKEILDANVTWIKDNKYVVTGSYGVSSRSQLAVGLYFSEFDGEEQNYIRYHSFTEFKNFLDYLNPKAKEKLEKKIEKKQAKGVEDVLKCLIVLHPVIQKNKQYVLIGEVYYPTYRTETYTTFSNGKATTQTRQVFDGYQYTHASVLGMDEEGNKIWDECFEMYLTHKPFSVVKNIRINKTEKNLTMMFCSGKNFKSCIIDGDGAVEKDMGTLETEEENQKIKWTSYSSAKYWYDNYFLTYGWQTLKNAEEKVGKRKKSFFVLTKISL